MGGTKINAIREAKDLLQLVGFSGFSLQQVADRLGIKKPSLYEHFASKEALGKALIEDYLRTFIDWSETISVFSPKEQIGALFEVFFKFSSDDCKVCPLSALVGDYNALPKGMKKLLNQAFACQRDWLKVIIKRGQKERVIRKDIPSEKLAELILAMAFGSQQMARIAEDPNYIRRLKSQAVSLLEA